MPHKASVPRTPTQLEKLRDKGFSVTLCSIQRNLDWLSTPFSLQCDDSKTPFRWSFTRKAPLKLEDIDATTYWRFTHLDRSR